MKAAMSRLLHRLFPQGQLELPPNAEDSFLSRVCPRLTRDLQRIAGASLLYQRSPEGVEGGGSPQFGYETDEHGDDDSYESVSNVDRHPASYHLFFLGLTDESMSYVCEDASTYWEAVDTAAQTLGEEEPFPFRGAGQGWIGCTLAVSVLARNALLVFDTFEVYTEGGNTIPDFRPHIFDMESRPIEMESHIGESMGMEAVIALHSLKEAIRGVLKVHRIELLTPPEADEVIPWLAPGEETLGLPPSGPVTVKDAFFFEQV